jgi:nitric oxide reductase subunit B
MRVPGDVVFAIGMLFLALFAIRLLKGAKRNQPTRLSVAPVARAKEA